jgi:hypothetical protein
VNKSFTPKNFLKWQLSVLRFLCFSILFCRVALPQDNVHQRTFPVSVSEANTAVQKISSSSKGRLPILEGFIQQAGQSIERYDKGYFECTFQVLPSGAGTLVRVTAKVTAWFSDPDPAQSGYRALVSNGRLEDDALDRIADVLTQSSSAKTSSKIATPPLPGYPFGDTRRTVQDSVSTAGPSANLGARAGLPLHRSTVPSASLPSASLEPSKAVRTAEEKRAQELSDYIKNMEEIQRNQSHPDDLAAVKKPKTPVFAKPSETSQVLLEADAQDEFQVLGVDGAWVHVQISGLSRGWVHRGQLEMPLGFSTGGASQETPPTPDATFRIAREETTPFRGNWQPLKGKPVRIEWIEPANPAVSTSPKEKLVYAKSIFLRAFRNLAQSQPSAEGIVVVFDSADGGQIAAPLSSVKALADRTLSETVFWRQCSLDPPESFIDSAKP